MITILRNRVLQTLLILSVLLTSGLVQAERSKKGSGSSGTAVSEPGDSNIPPAECRDILESYREFVTDPLSQLEESVVQDINAVLSSNDTCDEKVSRIEEILNAYWATEPWCRKDRETFLQRYTSEVSARLTSEARTIVTTLLSQGSLTCSETLYAAVTVVRFYDPSFVLYDMIPIDGTMSTQSGNAQSEISSKVEFNVDDVASKKSSKRKLKACQAKVKRLTNR
jgi:hypothetical protein